MKSRLILAAVSALLCLPSLPAQSSPAMANAGGAEAATDVGKYSNMNQMMGKQVGSMRFYGKVEVAGGKLPWDPIPIVVACAGKIRYSTVTDPKGGFNIVPPGRDSEVISQKKDPAHYAPTELIGCSVSAVAEGFTSKPLNIANRTLLDDPSLGTITLDRDEHATGSIISSTTESAPPDAMKEFEKAHGDDQSGHAGSARHHLEKAVSIDPKFAEAWYHLGKIEQTDDPAQALDAYRKAAADDATFLPSWEGIAAVSATQKKWHDVLDATSTSLRLDPTGSPEIWYFNAVGNFNLGNAREAEASAETSLAMDPSHRAPNTEQLLAVILAGRGDYTDALQHLQNCLTYLPPGPNMEVVRQQVSQLEKAVGQAPPK